MRVLSLFDGISGARLSLEKLNIKVDEYYACEVDKYAIQVSQKNYPDIIQLGDVTQVDFKRLKPINLLIGGFPCQDLSIAKKDRQGLRGERSGLFRECLRALEGLKPDYFLFENVASMKNSDRDKISELLGVEPIMINSALLVAQQRKRYYWTNIPGVQQPEDKHIYLKDILESGSTDKLKSYCIDANYYKGTSLEQYLTKCRRQLIFENIGDINLPARIVGRRLDENGTRDDYNKNIDIKQYLEINKDVNKTNTLSTVGKDNVIVQLNLNKPIRIGQIGKGGQGGRIYSIEGKSVNLNANGGGGGAKTGLYYTDHTVRKLTTVECERLQSYPDGYTSCVSNTQAYKALGNSFTVDVIAHILSYMEIK